MSIFGQICWTCCCKGRGQCDTRDEDCAGWVKPIPGRSEGQEAQSDG